MDDQTLLKLPPTPTMPLFPLSPERVNGSRPSPATITATVPESPSTPAFGATLDFGHPEFGTPGDFSKFGKGDFEEASVLSISTPLAHRENAITPSKIVDSAFSRPKHARTNSDVQGMVARFNSLDIKDHAEMRKKDANLLKRERAAREQAEREVAEMKEAEELMRENDMSLRKELEESKDREARVMKRLDALMEDLHRSKESQAQAKNVYEKELRRAKKEIFKSSSMVVKMQEEFKATKKSLSVAQSDLDTEKEKVAQREQETFSAQYQMIGLQEDLKRAQEKVKVVEDERDALKTNLKEEEVARIAAEGRIALPSSDKENDEFSSPRKQQPRSARLGPAEEPTLQFPDTRRLQEELNTQRRLLQLAEEQIEFMKMECQFGCCSCRVAEQRGTAFVHDGTFETEVQKYKHYVTGSLTPPASVVMDVDIKPSSPTERLSRNTQELEVTMKHEDVQGDPSMDLVPSSNTEVPKMVPENSATQTSQSLFDGIVDEPKQSPVEPSLSTQGPDSTVYKDEISQLVELSKSPDSFTLTSPWNADQSVQSHAVEQPLVNEHMEEDEPQQQLQVSSEIQEPSEDQHIPDTPHDKPYRTVTTTTKVPLADPDTPDYSAFCSPMKISREEAIEQLRQRRGRARSVIGTPKKGANDGQTPRRDISAPESRPKATPRNASRGRPLMR